MKRILPLLLSLFIVGNIFGQWSSLTNPYPRCYAKPVVFNGKIYFNDGYKTLATKIRHVEMVVFDPESESFDTISKPLHANHPAMAVTAKGIYQFGGFDLKGDELTDRSFLFDGENWTEIAPMPEKAPFFANNGIQVGSKIIIQAGAILRDTAFTEQSVVTTNHIYIYDETTNEWSIDSLSMPRILVGMATDGENVVFAGGKNEDGITDVVDIYNVNEKTWTTTHLSSARASVEVAYLNGKFYFCGGDFTGYAKSSD
ncbi:MAG: hypothetical protein KDC92_14430, partial [Bacteroidetes bacterium]|nr:hypothetical protein [Bacteroidota bacterium]